MYVKTIRTGLGYLFTVIEHLVDGEMNYEKTDFKVFIFIYYI